MLACFSGTPSISDQLVGAANGRTSSACETLTGLYVNHSTHKLTNTPSGIALSRQFRVPPKQKSRPSTNTSSQIALCANLASPQNKSPVLPQTHPSQTALCASLASPLNTHPVSFHPVPPPYSSSIYILHNPPLCAILKPVKTTKTT